MKSVSVFCGSSAGAHPSYAATARRLGEALVEHGLTLVYGGASVGLMGILADTVLQHGGRVIGVLPAFMNGRERAHPGLSELCIVESMHERKAMMAERADAFVALPGGFGTLEEIFEVFTWAQLGLHSKPCALLDVDGYYEHLERFLDHATGEGFVKPSFRSLLIKESDPVRLLLRLRDYQPPQIPRLLRSPQEA